MRPGQREAPFFYSRAPRRATCALTAGTQRLLLFFFAAAALTELGLLLLLSQRRAAQASPAAEDAPARLGSRAVLDTPGGITARSDRSDVGRAAPGGVDGALEEVWGGGGGPVKPAAPLLHDDPPAVGGAADEADDVPPPPPPSALRKKGKKQRKAAPAGEEDGDAAPAVKCTPAPAPAAGGSSSSSVAVSGSLNFARDEQRLPYLPDPGRHTGRPLLRAWRAGLLDWHDLVPTLPRRFKDNNAAADAYRWKRLVGSELDVLTHLQGWGGVRGRTDAEAGILGDVGPWYAPDAGSRTADHGPLAKYALCPAIRDACMIHASARECVKDERCGWCAPPQVSEPALAAKAGYGGSGGGGGGWNGAGIPGFCTSRLRKHRPEPVASLAAPSCPVPLMVLRASVVAAEGTGATVMSETGGAVAAAPRQWGHERRAVPLVTGAGLDVNHGQPAPGGAALREACAVVATRAAPVGVAIEGNAKMAFHFFTEISARIHSDLVDAGNAPVELHTNGDEEQDDGSGDGVPAPRGGWEPSRVHIYLSRSSELELSPLLHVYTDSCWSYDDAIPAPHDGEADGALCYLRGPLVDGDAADAGDGEAAVDEEEGLGIAFWDVVSRVSAAPPPHIAHYLTATAAPGRSAALRLLGTVNWAVQDGMRVGPVLAARILAEATAQGASTSTVLAGAGHAKRASELFSSNREIKAWHGAGGMPGFVVAALGLGGIAPGAPGAAPDAPRRPFIALLSRRNKRLILNERELVESAEGLGAAVAVASLETMPLYEQVRLFRRASILAGIHGSGLINSIFMAPGTALVQLMPFNVRSGASFFQGPAEGNGVSYYEWNNQKRENTVFHWHFLGADFATPEARENAVTRGSDCCGAGVYFSFWINQDTFVDVDEWAALLRRVLTTSNVNAALAKAG